VPPQPAGCDGPFDASAELVRCAALFEEAAFDLLDVNAAIRAGSIALAISTSFRAAASGSMKRFGSTTSCGFHVGDVDVLAHALDVDHCSGEASGLAAR
jgi:hypothetical protein